MAQMDILRRANQQARRLKAAGVSNDALAAFLVDKKAIKENTADRKERGKKLRKVAAKFLRKKESTLRGIKETFEHGVKTGRITQKAARAIGDDVSKMARYLSAGREARRYIEAKELGLASDQIAFLNQRLDNTTLSAQDRKRVWYNVVGKLTDEIYDNNGATPDVLTNIIMKSTARYQIEEDTTPATKGKKKRKRG